MVAALIAGVTFFTGYFGGPDVSYQATIDTIVPFGSNQVLVSVEVTNLSGTSATPTCQINADSPGNAVTGVETFTADQPIPGGLWADYSMMIPVTANGATYVTVGASTATCH